MHHTCNLLCKYLYIYFIFNYNRVCGAHIEINVDSIVVSVENIKLLIHETQRSAISLFAHLSLLYHL